MIWLILIALVLIMFWPKIKSLLSGSSSAATTAGQGRPTGDVAITTPVATGMTTIESGGLQSQTVNVQAPKVGPLAGLLGQGIGSIAQTGITTAVSVPRNLFGGIKSMFNRR